MKTHFEPESKVMFAIDVEYDAKDEYIKRIRVQYFDVKDNFNGEQPTRIASLRREKLLSLIDEGCTIYVSIPHSKNVALEDAVSEIVRYRHPENGKTYITTQAVIRGRDNLGILPRIK